MSGFLVYFPPFLFVYFPRKKGEGMEKGKGYEISEDLLSDFETQGEKCVVSVLEQMTIEELKELRRDLVNDLDLYRFDLVSSGFDPLLSETKEIKERERGKRLVERVIDKIGGGGRILKKG